MNHGPISPTATLLSRSFQAAAAAATSTVGGPSSLSSSSSDPDTIVHEAFQLHNLQTQANSSLLEFGLNLGFIERRPNDGRLTIDSLNAFPMSSSKLVGQLLTELLMRLGIFIPATTLIKLAIDSDNEDPDREDAIRCLYILSIILHQIANYDDTSIRTLNRLLMCVAIILFSLTTTNSKPCEEMRKFKEKIRKRLLIDYYLWCLLFAMNFVLTCGSPLYINLEHAHGIELHLVQLALSTFCVVHLCFSMRIIGYGRLAPLITGTPLLFLDAGDDITLAKGSTLFLCYFCFWCSDWRELVDWNHSMLCDAGICKILNTEPGNLRARVKKAKLKFDDWRLEEGLDDDGWFILLDAPANLTATGATMRPHTNESSSEAAAAAASDESQNHTSNNDVGNDRPEAETANVVDQDSEPGSEPAAQDDVQQEAEEEEDDEQRLIDYSDRVIYLQSRNPLLTTLAAIMLIVWK